MLRMTLCALLVMALAAIFASTARGGSPGVSIEIDFAVSDNSDSRVGAIQTCLEVASGGAYTLDVIIAGDGVTDAVAAQLTISYPPGSLTGRDIGQSLLNNEQPDAGGQATIDGIASGGLPNADGSHTVVISNDPAIGSGGTVANAVGIMIR